MDATKRRLTAAAIAAALSISLTACTTSNQTAQPSDGSGTSGSIEELRYMVPNAPGSGWDTTARTAAKALQDAGLVSDPQVFNVDGANGTVGLARLASESGTEGLIMQMGLGLVGATVTLDTEVTLSDVTPIAKLIDDLEVVFVSADSPYKTIDDLVEAWEDDPTAMAIGGGSSPGGADHLVPMLMAEELGIEATDVAYTSLGGSGVMPAVLGNQVGFAVTGAGDVVQQVEAGNVIALAVSGSERLADLPDVPTLEESGIDVTVTNWRGVVAPPGISDDHKEQLVALVEELHGSDAWQAAAKANGWVDSFVPGDEFGALIAEQEATVAKLIDELGL